MTCFSTAAGVGKADRSRIQLGLILLLLTRSECSDQCTETDACSGCLRGVPQ